jgi:hypothetical protein
MEVAGAYGPLLLVVVLSSSTTAVILCAFYFLVLRQSTHLPGRTSLGSLGALKDEDQKESRTRLTWPTDLIPSCPPQLPASLLPHVPEWGYFNVVAFGAAADGSDDTAAFVAALDAAAKCGGGSVFVPAGTYTIKGTLKVPKAVTLRGANEFPFRSWGHPGGQPEGTTLLAYAGQSDEGAEPFITLNQVRFTIPVRDYGTENALTHGIMTAERRRVWSEHLLPSSELREGCDSVSSVHPWEWGQQHCQELSTRQPVLWDRLDAYTWPPFD